MYVIVSGEVYFFFCIFCVEVFVFLLFCVYWCFLGEVYVGDLVLWIFDIGEGIKGLYGFNVVFVFIVLSFMFI